jgi:hypothetical protein
MQHSFLHFLGFETGLITYDWIDVKTGLPYNGADGLPYFCEVLNSCYITTENVQAAARTYYNCPTLMGM